MAKRALLVVICLTAVGCGGDTDHSSSFTGTWSGTGGCSAVPVDPTHATSSSTSTQELWDIGPLEITSKGLNTVDIAGVCPGGDGPTMDVVSASDLDGGKYTCKPTTNIPPGCSAASTLTFDGGSGTAVNNSLTLALTGKYTYCGQDYVITLTFYGFRG
jgi:hypothetical protein